MLVNILPADELRSLATRKAKDQQFKSVRHPLVDEELAGGWTVVRKNRANTRLSKPKAHDRTLEDRIWTLLYRMGFKYLSGPGGANLLVTSNDPASPENQIDVVAIDEDVAFAIECKSSEKPRKFNDFSRDLAKHITLRDRFVRAIKDQFAEPSRKPSIFAMWTSNIVASDNDRARAKAERVPLLDESDLEYYEQLVGQVGPAARFQFLADLLEGRPITGLEIRVPAIKTRMTGGAAYTFSVSPEYLLKIAFVSHRAKGKASDIDTYQRLLKKNRLKSIRQYITDGGIFPTNIVVNVADQRWLSFDRGKQEGESKSSTFGWLHIRPSYRVAWIIDGQHRLFAYANHPLAKKSLVSVMAFVGLEPSEQARLFVDINAQQKKVKQSLLQELYAELHWDAEEPDVRVQAILSKVIQVMDTELTSPFHGRILKADDARTDTRCISLTSIFRAVERSSFFIARTKKNVVVEYGPLWAVTNEATLRRTAEVLMGYFEIIKSETNDLWTKGSADGGGLAMNDGVTVCINVLRSIFNHLEDVKRVRLSDLENKEILKAVEPYARSVGGYFASLSGEQMIQFRSLRGIQGQTAGTRRIEEALRRSDAAFDPPGLKEFLDRERAQTSTRAYEIIKEIEKTLQSTILSELRDEFGKKEEDWWFPAIPKGVRKKIDDRINEEAGKTGGREQNFDLIDYREIIAANWLLFEATLGRGKGNKESRTKWIVEVNELRKPVMHASRGQSLPVTEEQVAFLEETQRWLETQVGAEAEV